MTKARIIEIKARCSNPDKIREYLMNHDAFFKGKDHQVDTYFNVPEGRLKLRQGSIESNLIFYNRSNIAGPKESEVNLYKPNKSEDLKMNLIAALGIKVVVDKKREIYFINNVKFHIDSVKDLGSFMEIEAIDETGEFTIEDLRRQCSHYISELGLNSDDFIEKSYSDLLLETFK